ncbi:MAG: hypothetical protein PGN13_12005 [Patulibacter minatonensis]
MLVARSYLSEPLGGFFFVLAAFAFCVAISKRGRSWRRPALAGFLLGMAVLSRNDLLLLFGVFPGLAALMIWRREDLRTGITVGAIALAAAIVTVTPWVTYASIETGKLTPITTAGPSSLWVATYLPAGGRQIIAKRQFMKEVCATFPDRQDACGVTATQMDMRLIWELFERKHPGLTQEEAIQAELDRNIRDYAFGQPLKFGEMLVNKSGRIWGRPWGGGGIGRMESSVTQHRAFLGLALLGVLAGGFFGGRRRRYVWIAFAALFTVTALNTIFVSESRMSLRMTPLFLAVGIGGAGAALRARRGDDEPEFMTTADDDAEAPNGDAPLRDPVSSADHLRDGTSEAGDVTPDDPPSPSAPDADPSPST